MKKRLLLISPPRQEGTHGERFLFPSPLPGAAQGGGSYSAKMLRDGRIIDHDWDNYNTHNVVFRPRLLTPERLLEGYWWAFKESYSCPSIIKRIWGNGTRYNFFYPMNYGYRQSINKALRDDAIGGKWR